MYQKNTWQFWVFLLLAWVLFPISAAWLMLAVTKRVITGGESISVIDEREDCAQICNDLMSEDGEKCARSIRARTLTPNVQK